MRAADQREDFAVEGDRAKAVPARGHAFQNKPRIGGDIECFDVIKRLHEAFASEDIKSVANDRMRRSTALERHGFRLGPPIRLWAVDLIGVERLTWAAAHSSACRHDFSVDSLDCQMIPQHR